MHARTRQLLLGATTSCLLQACMIVQADEGAAPGNETILAAELSADLHFLAGDEMAGRLVGSPEIALAATFIEGRFRRLGLEPAGPGGSYYQRFDLHWFSLGRANNTFLTAWGLARRPGGRGRLGPTRFQRHGRGLGRGRLCGLRYCRARPRPRRLSWRGRFGESRARAGA